MTPEQSPSYPWSSRRVHVPYIPAGDQQARIPANATGRLDFEDAHSQPADFDAITAQADRDMLAFALKLAALAVLVGLAGVAIFAPGLLVDAWATLRGTR